MDPSIWTVEHLPLSDVTLQYWQSSNAGLLPLVVMLHGLTACSGLLLTPVTHFLPNFSFILPDARGHGGSIPIPRGTLTMNHLVSDVVAVIRHVSPNAPVLLAGHSMGASTAARVARDYPHLIKGLLLVEPPWDRLPEDVLTLSEFLTPEKVAYDILVRQMLLEFKSMSFNDFRAVNVDRISPLFPFQTTMECNVLFDTADVSIYDMEPLSLDISLAVGNITVNVVLQIGDLATATLSEGSKLDPVVADVMLSRYPRGEKQFFLRGEHSLFLPPTRNAWNYRTLEALEHLAKGLNRFVE